MGVENTPRWKGGGIHAAATPPGRRLKNVFADARNGPNFPIDGIIDGERTPNALTGIEGKRLTG